MRITIRYPALVAAALVSACACSLPCPAASPARIKHEILLVGGRAVHYEFFDVTASPAVVLLLHGASGPSGMEAEARDLAQHGVSAVVLHYYDASRRRQPDEQNYLAWVRAVDLLVARFKSGVAKPVPVVLFGVSLGASLALAAGSQVDGADAVIDWSGSLPDYFFAHLKGMPPLLILHGGRDTNVPVTNARQLERLCQMAHFDCQVHIFPGQGHIFQGDALREANALAGQFITCHSSGVPRAGR